MNGAYAAFTFVDRIVSFTPGLAARGTFHIPARIDAFPSSLLAEATGQLAAWVAIDKLGFRRRPVAGIAHESIYDGVPRPGDTLETEIRIDSCEDDAVKYQGSARIDGKVVFELHDCVGPMLPIEEFDDPAAMRRFLTTLRSEGARRDRFPGIDILPLVELERDAGRFASARLEIPAEAPFFDDHFPRRPVFPGTLLLDRMSALASELVAEAMPGGTPFARRISDVKLRAFIEPALILELRANVEVADLGGVIATVEARAEGQRRPVGAARVEFEVR